MKLASIRIAPRLRLFALGCVVAGCLPFAGAAAADDRQPGSRPADERRRAWQEMPPEQRREIWQSLPSEQRELLMRRVPRDERKQLWNQMTPEQRDEMRQRFTERRERQTAEGRPHLSPEERQRLRDQIRESQRDWKKKPAPDNR